MWLPELVLLAGIAAAEPPTVVVTIDNGGFNAPLFAPRWTGFARPSVAREVATSVARVAGRNPEMWTYLPPGRVEGRPGEPWRVEPRRPGCEGAASEPADPCYCGPGDRCWTELDVNRHPGGSTSLYLTAATLRGAASGPRIEVHFTDLFEEDPSSAENPADSDRCVTRSGVRKAMEGLVGGGAEVDHLAVGLLRVRLDPPPPGGNAGSVFRFQEGEGGCWSGARVGSWAAGAEPLDWAMGVLIVGLQTREHHDEVADFLDGLEVQLRSDQMALSVVRLREPAESVQASASLRVEELGEWTPPASARVTGLPCEAVHAEAELFLDGQPLAGVGSTGDCGGGAKIALPPEALHGAWARAHGLDPFAGPGRLTGTVQLRGEPDAAVRALARLAEVNREVADRPLPFIDVVEDLAHSGSGGMQTFHREISLDLQVSGLDRRPWLQAGLIGLIFALAAGFAAHAFLIRVQANRAYQAAWDRAVGADGDPLRQRPVAAVLADAQEDLRGRWAARWVAALGLALGTGVLVGFLLLRASLVTLG